MKFIITYILLISSFIGFSQENQEDSTQVLFRTIDDYNDWNNLNFENLDLFQNYRIYNINSPLARLGNLGLPIHYFDSIPLVTNISTIAGAYSPFLKSKSNLSFYDTKTPFTSLNYVTGAENEQQFTVLHTQNFGDRMNVSFEYQRITSEGFYSRQLTNHTMFNGNYSYSSFNKRFSSIGYYSVASLEALDNGGIIIGESENPDDNTVLLDINLGNAQSQIRNRLFGFKNEYKILKHTDTTNNISIGHEIEINRVSRNYDDLVATNGDFYFNNFIDAEQTLDTSFAQVISNDVFVDIEFLNLKLGLNNSQYNYFQNFLIDEDINSNYLNAQLDRDYEKIKLGLAASKGLSGYHKNELDLSIDAKYKLNSRFLLNGRLVSQIKRPNPLMNRMRLNHSFLDAELENIELNQMTVSVFDSISKSKIHVQYSSYQKMVYYDEKSIIRNYSNSLNIVKVSLDKRTKLSRLFNLYSNISFQSTNVDSVIPIPSIVSYNSFFFSNSYFENSLKLQVGADFYYVSEYTRSSYNPSLVQFYRDNNDELNGSIIQLDLFLNLAINKGAKVFFKFENLLEEPFSEDSYRVQGYAIPGRAMKIGISWRMLN